MTASDHNLPIEAGQQLPPLRLAPLSRTTLALYAGASGDHNPIHIDIDAARRIGLPDVFAHGMLSMAWLGRLVTQWIPQQRLRRLSTRFTGITHVGDEIVCSGQVVDQIEFGGERLWRVEIRAMTQDGTTTLLGEALVAS